MKKLIKRILLKSALMLFSSQPESLIYEIVEKYINSHSAKDSLNFLFNIDNRLYTIQGQMAVKYGNGTHPKHRHTKYHQFFIDRIQPKQRVLDIGCGYGSLAFDIAEHAEAYVDGIDLNAKNIKKAEEIYAHERITYYTGDAVKDLPQGSYDIVVLSNVLEHITERDEFLNKICSLVKPQRFLIRVPLFEREWQVPLKKELGIEWRLDPTHETEYTQESFTEELHRARLNITYQEVRWGEIWAEVRENVT